MARLRQFLLGPELYWVLVYLAMHMLASGNVPPTESCSQALEKWWFILPLVALPLTFLVYLIPQPSPWWMLLRINLIGFFGLCFASYRVTDAIDYQDSRNSGVPMGWVLSIGFAMFVLPVADAVAVAVIAWRKRKRKRANANPPPLD